MAWIDTVPPERAEGRLAAFYQQILKQAVVVPHIYQIQSLDVEALESHAGMYRAMVFGRKGLRRYQREMIATRVSSINECHY